MNLSWWCAAQGGAWDWTWQPYVGVWLLVGALIGIRVLAARAWGHPNRGSTSSTDEPAMRSTERRMPLYLLGAALLWVAADWPVGPLGAGYLLSVHTVQYLLFAFIIPPLLIAGTPPSVFRRVIQPRWAFRVAWTVSRPLVAFLCFNVILLATHLPAVVDGLTVSQLGSFAVDMSWLAAGLIFWWPILGPLPELRPMPYPGRIVYLIANVFIPTVPASFLTFARYPIYALYELAPPMSGLTAVEDQQLAGLIMKILGGFIVFGTASVLFFKWSTAEEREDSGGGNTPDGGDDGDQDRPRQVEDPPSLSHGEPALVGDT
jgi:putative membrane protein